MKMGNRPLQDYRGLGTNNLVPVNVITRTRAGGLQQPAVQLQVNRIPNVSEIPALTQATQKNFANGRKW